MNYRLDKLDCILCSLLWSCHSSHLDIYSLERDRDAKDPHNYCRHQKESYKFDIDEDIEHREFHWQSNLIRKYKFELQG